MENEDNLTRRPWAERWKRLRALSQEQRLDLAVALLRRDPLSRRDTSFEFVRKRYPDAADDLVHAIVHHLYWTLPTDFCDLLAYLELCMQERQHHAHSGLIYGILYNLYNLMQAERLVPYGRHDVFDSLKEVTQCLEADDREGALATLKGLLEKFEGHESPPGFD